MFRVQFFLELPCLCGDSYDIQSHEGDRKGTFSLLLRNVEFINNNTYWTRASLLHIRFKIRRTKNTTYKERT